MSRKGVLRVCGLAAAAGLVANVGGVLLARAFRGHPQWQDVFVATFGVGLIAFALGGGGTVALVLWPRRPHGSTPKAVAAAIAGVAAAAVLWVCALYWPFVLFANGAP